MPSPVIIAVSLFVVLLVIALSLYFTNTVCSWGSWAGSSCASPSGSSYTVSENVTRLTALYAALMTDGCQARWSAFARYIDSTGIKAIPVNQTCPSGTQDPPTSGPGSQTPAAGFKTCNPITPVISSIATTPQDVMAIYNTPCPQLPAPAPSPVTT